MAKLTQDQLLEIFYDLKKILKPYEKGNVKARYDMEGKYDLWSEKSMVAHGKQRDEMSFVTLIIQSGYVGFYFMPIYNNTEEVQPRLGEALLKTLKGKSCFHIKSNEPALLGQVEEAMKRGFEVYQKNGWV